MNFRRLVRFLPLALALCGAAVGAMGSSARADDQVTFLLPAQIYRPALAPWVLAKVRGYYKAEGLDLELQSVTGGAEVAKQVGIGNAAMGEAVCDATIIVRSNGVPIKAVGLIGGGSFTQLIVNADSSITSPADLKGKTVSVFAYQDTTYYALLGAIYSAGLTKSDVDIVAGGPTNVWAMFLDKRAQAMGVAPDYIAIVTAKGAKVRVIPINDYFPTMAQAILASDKMIAERPEVVRKVVRATLRGMQAIVDDTDGALADYIKATPENAGNAKEIRRVFDYYKQYVFGGQAVPGAIDPKRLATVQDFYVKQGIVAKKLPLDALYTNQFVQ
jgi:NitT/TauT family transport system substrate-binding protein